MDLVARRRLVLPDEAAQKIKEHKYVGGVYSKLDLLLKKHLWVPCGESVPKWVAPNLITITGLVIMSATSLNLARYCPTMTEEAPRYAYLLAGTGVFLYQTLDAMDGIQARRTGTSSPLGQLVDHGCDALIVTFFILVICCAARTGHQHAYLYLGMCHTIYFLAQWEEFHTGVLRTGCEYFGNTELQCVTYIMIILCGIAGPWIADVSLVPGLRFQDLLFYLFLGCCLFSFGLVFHTVMKVCHSRKYALKQLVPFIPAVAMVYIWFWISSVTHPHFFFLALGFSLSYLECWMIFASFGDLKFSSMFCKIAWPVPILVVMMQFDMYRDYEPFVCGCHFIYVTMTLYRFLQQASEELCMILNVRFWTIPYKEA